MALAKCTVENEVVSIYTANGLVNTDLPPFLVLNNKEEGFIYLEHLGVENGFIKCGLPDAYDISNLFEDFFEKENLVSEQDFIQKGYYHFESESKSRYKEWLTEGLKSDMALIHKHLERIQSL